MHTTRIIYLLSVLIFVSALKSRAQTCSGSLGDPVIYQTFGSGSNPGKPLSSDITNMSYTANNCPDDGEYTIVNAANLDSKACHPTWQTVTHDHTGNPNGYMMLINASFAPSIFFTQTAKGLCPNTTYEFSAYILNMMTFAASGPDVIEPNITFTIETMDHKVLATYNTGIIQPTVNPEWNKYGTYFTTPEGVTDVIVLMNNNAPGGNGNDLILDDIAFRACGPIVQTGFGDLSSTGDQNICKGDNATYTLTSSVGAGYTNPFLQWQINKNNSGWTAMDGETHATLNIIFNNAVAGTYQYRLAVGEGGNNTPSCYVSSLPLTVNVNPPPDAGITPVTPRCEGQPLVLYAADGGESYEWTGPNGYHSNQQNPVVSAAATTADGGLYTIKMVAKGCPSFATTNVTISPKIVPGVSDNISICEGASTQLFASGGLTYKWTPSTGLDHDDIANPIANPSQTTTYNVTISNDGCTDNSKSVTVTVLKNPTADAGTSQTIFEGQSIKLNGVITGDNIQDYYWTPSDHLDNPHSLTPTASPVHNTLYTLNVVSGSCGQATSSVFVRVYEKVTVPNAFTPNGDGVNDYWNIDKLITYPNATVMVYTRSGKQVYHSTGYSKSWDGTYGGDYVSAGTYYYIIDLKIGTPQLSGWLLIVR